MARARPTATEPQAPAAFAAAPGLLPEAVVSTVGYRVVEPEPVIHRGLPSPSLTFVLSLDDPIVTGASPEQAVAPDAYRNTVILSGLHTTPAYIAQPRVQAGVQMAVRPLAARALFGMPAAELRALSTEAEDLLGPGVSLLREQLAELPSWDQRFAAVAGYLRARWADPPRMARPRPEIAEAWTWIARHRGTGSMAGLARHVHLSPRQLTALFRAEIGMTPKTVSRLMRFEHARQRLAGAVRAAPEGPAVDIAGIAHACGYFDHSHLVRDFRAYVGLSPTRWLAEERRNIQAGMGQETEDWAA